MRNDQIEKFILSDEANAKRITIHFKSRNPVVGFFIQASDFKELKSKNFWRIVTGPSIDIWTKSMDMSVARIFNGAEFTKLSLPVT